MTVRECFISVPKHQVAEALLERVSPADQDALRLVFQMLGAIFHFETHDEAERLRVLYFPLDPSHPQSSAADPAAFMTELERVLAMANFRELPANAVARGGGKSAIADLKVKTNEVGVRRVRFFYRGARPESVRLERLGGLLKREIVTEVLDDVLLVIELDDDPKALKRIKRGARPGAVLLKHFGDVPGSDLVSLHPGAAPAMKRHDQLMLGVPAVAGGLPLLTQLVPALGVIFTVLAALIGFEGGQLTESALKQALAALSLFVGLGAFLMRQRLKYDRQRLYYQKKLTETVYFHTLANNAGVISGLVTAAEEQDCKEAMLAYCVLLERGPQSKSALDAAVEAWLKERFAIDADFEIGDALDKLQRLGLARMDHGAIVAVPFAEAIRKLDAAWDGYFAGDDRQALSA